MTLPMLNLFIALLDIVFALAFALTALASLFHVRWEHGIQSALDTMFVLLGGFLAWGALSGSVQSFDRITDPRLQSSPVDGLAYFVLTLCALLACALLYLSLRKIKAAMRESATR